MRIRKRFLSLSAAAVTGSSDPHGGDHHHNHRLPPPLLVVQHQQQVHPNGNLRVLYNDPPPNHCCFPPPPCSADHTIQTGVEPSGFVSSGAAGGEEKKSIAFTHKELESENRIEKIKTHDAGRKESILCPETSSCASSTPSPPTTANLVLKGWLEGDRLIPIKKRRGSFGKKVNHDDIDEDNEIDEKKPKPRKNDKCVTKQEGSATCPKKNKNGKRGNVIMEGSRCSRVNGRGWRCCQQTLIGYSLCEHHLGKGRLRSMRSFRGRAQKIAPKEQVMMITEERKDKEDEMISIDHRELEDDHDDDDDDDDEEELKGWEAESIKSSVEGIKTFSKKKKLGVVKARSLSSLLSQMGS